VVIYEKISPKPIQNQLTRKNLMNAYFTLLNDVNYEESFVTTSNTTLSEKNSGPLYINPKTMREILTNYHMDQFSFVDLDKELVEEVYKKLKINIRVSDLKQIELFVVDKINIKKIHITTIWV